VGREELILEVAVLQSDTVDEVAHLDRFLEVAGERLLAGDAEQRALPDSMAETISSMFSMRA
jgi:hypothetical protein